MRGVELTLEEREAISRGLAEGLSHRMIAARLDRNQSVISREVARNGGNAGYRAADAQKRADERRRRPKAFKLETHVRLHDAVAERLSADFSPEQVSNRLKKDSRMIRRCACRTRRSTRRSSFRRVAN